MADQDEVPSRTRSTRRHDSESSSDAGATKKALVDWGSCESLTSDGHLRGNEN